jgi:hypothetical protein
MVEQGLVLLIQNGIASAYPGVLGYATQLPPNQVSEGKPKAFTYRSLYSKPSYFLQGQDGLTDWGVQIDAVGFTAADSQQLARAIQGVLRGGYQGTLPDSDATVVQAIFQMGLADGFNNVNQTFIRSIDYCVSYIQI